MLSILTFASPIWSPHTRDKFSHLNSVPKKLLRYAAAKSGVHIDYDEHDYSEVSKALKVFTIESHHKVNDVNFVAKILK